MCHSDGCQNPSYYYSTLFNFSYLLKYLGLPKCIVSKLTCFPKIDSAYARMSSRDVIGNVVKNTERSCLKEIFLDYSLRS